MSEKEKVTLRLETLNVDDDILQAEPLDVWKRVDRLKDLDSPEILENIADRQVVFVKNLGGLDVEIPNSGAYYRWDAESKSWTYIAVGTHSHTNARLLDQIGNNITPDDIAEGTQKYMGLELDDNGDFKIVYNDIPAEWEIPEKPETDVPLQLTLLPDNKLAWTSSKYPLPAQSFQYLTSVLDDSKISKFENVKYNPDKDTVITIANGLFVSNVNIDYLESVLTLTVNDEHVDANSEVSILIVRSGIDYLFDILESKYISKEQALDILAGADIDISKVYATKDELAKKVSRADLNYLISKTFANINHNHHLMYSKLDHLHDDIYLRKSDTETAVKKVVDDYFANKTGSASDVIDILKQLDSLVSGNDTFQTLIKSKADKKSVYTKDQVYSKEEAVSKRDLEETLGKVVSTVNGKTGPHVTLTAEDIRYIPDEGDGSTLKEYIENQDEYLKDLKAGKINIPSAETAKTADSADSIREIDNDGNIHFHTADDIVKYGDIAYQNLSDESAKSAKILDDIITEPKYSGDTFKVKASELDGIIPNVHLSDDFIISDETSKVKFRITRDLISGSFKLAIDSVIGGGSIADIDGFQELLDSKIDDVYYVNNFVSTLNAQLGSQDIQVYSKDEIEKLLTVLTNKFINTPSSGYIIRGSISKLSELLKLKPDTLKLGYLYNCLENGLNYVWTGTEKDDPPGIGWSPVSSMVNLGNYYDKDETDAKFAEVTNLIETETVKPSEVLKNIQVQEPTIAVVDTDKKLTVSEIPLNELVKKSDINELTASKMLTSTQFSVTLSANDFSYNGTQYIAIKDVPDLFYNTDIWAHSSSTVAAKENFHLRNVCQLDLEHSRLVFYASEQPVSEKPIILQGFTTRTKITNPEVLVRQVPITGIAQELEKIQFNENWIRKIYCGTSTDVVDE